MIGAWLRSDGEDYGGPTLEREKSNKREINRVDFYCPQESVKGGKDDRS